MNLTESNQQTATRDCTKRLNIILTIESLSQMPLKRFVPLLVAGSWLLI